MKKKNRIDDKRNTRNKKGNIERFSSLNKNNLESTLFFTLIKCNVKDRVYCLLCDFNQ